VHTNSVEVVRDYLEQGVGYYRSEEVNGSIRAHLEELHRRVRRLSRHDASIEVRVSPAVQALRNSLKARQEVWG
jgi:NifB/MoaA-like Fe-S oxidoreductase